MKAQPALAALYAQINHFNPSVYSISPEAWREAVLRLNQPENLLTAAALDQLACPTMFLVGAEDPIAPPAVMRELGQRLPGSEVVVVEEAAHPAYFEKVKEFNQTVLDFLRRRTDD